MSLHVYERVEMTIRRKVLCKLGIHKFTQLGSLYRIESWSYGLPGWSTYLLRKCEVCGKERR